MQPVTSLTKRAIRASFLKLLNERPLNKITVKDIVEQFRLLCHLRQGMMEEMVDRCCDKV